MAKLTVKANLPQIDGEYEFDETYFTNRELHLIKKETGLRAGDFEDALKTGDTDILVAVAMVALTRAGKGEAAPFLWDIRADQLTFEFAANAEDDALPPVSEPAASFGDNGSSERSGLDSVNGGESPESAPSRIGSLPSATGSI